MFVALISLVGILVSACLVRQARKVGLGAQAAAGTPDAIDAEGRARALPFVWCAIFMVLQAFIGVYAALGMVQNDAISATVLNLVLITCVFASLNRAAIADKLLRLAGPQGRFPHPLVVSVVLVVLGALFALLALEIPSNHLINRMYPLCFLLEWALIAVAMVGAYFLVSRRGGLAAFVAFLMYTLGVAEYFIVTFKSMPIQPGDISALSTAMAVAGTGYTYSLTAFCLYGLAFAAVALLMCQFAGILRPERKLRDRRTLAVNLLVAVMCFGGIAAHVTLVDYYNTLNITIYNWRPLDSYYRQGFIPTFISGAQTIKPPVPKGYNMDEAQNLLDEYASAHDEQAANDAARTEAAAQFDEEKPTVIAIMNETFSDLSIYQNMHAGYEGPQFFKSLPDCLSRGKLYVSAYGGGTCNTEFEFLTGNSMAYLGSGVYPYTIYDLTQTDNLAAQFKQLGYTTTAMHPNHGTNWNRENVYRDFGFDEFLTIEDFQGADQLRGMVTDKATYDKILDMLEQNSDPQFIFDVTMQNHSGYDTGEVPPEQQVNLSIDGQTDDEVNEYVSLIEESDKALEYFIDQLRQIDRKVVVVFFGDHQPFFPDEYNDRWFTDEDDTTHAMRLWQTNYLVWANYDVAGCEQTSQELDLSTNYLASLALDLAGAPLSDYQKAQIELRRNMPAINTTGYEDRSLRWYLSNSGASDDGDAAAADAEKARADYATIQYLKLFGDGKDVYTAHQQSAANETDPNLAPGTTKVL